MKGYKALSKDMKAIFGDGMQYELDKWYKIEGEIIPCKKGYHFFDNIRDIFILFCCCNYDIYEIEAKGKIIKVEDDDYQGKFVCNEIKLTRRLTQDEIKKYIEDNLDILVNDKDYDVKCKVARQGYGLDRLINDENYVVRCEVATQGYGLDILVNDECWVVRREVARQGYRLDILVNDENYTVRREVARQGYRLDILVNDKEYEVRCEVANQGYGLDILVSDEEYKVRYEVARQGYALDKLINDKNYDVRYVALETLVKQNEELLGVKLIRED